MVSFGLFQCISSPSGRQSCAFFLTIHLPRTCICIPSSASSSSSPSFLSLRPSSFVLVASLRPYQIWFCFLRQTVPSFLQSLALVSSVVGTHFFCDLSFSLDPVFQSFVCRCAAFFVAQYPCYLFRTLLVSSAHQKSSGPSRSSAFASLTSL